MKKLFIGLVSLISISSSYTALAGSDAYVTFYTSKKYLDHVNRGYIALEMINYPVALKEFLAAKYENRDLFAAYDGLGNLFEKTKRYDLAIQNYQKALNLIEPKYATDIVRKISYYRNTEQKRTAIGLYKIVLGIRPEAGLQLMYGDQSFNKKDYKSALKYYLRSIELQEDPEEYLKYLQVKYTNKDYERYIIQKYLKKSLFYPEAHYKAGQSYLKLKNFDKAIEEFDKAASQITVPLVENKYYQSLANAYYSKAISSKNPDQDLLKQAIKYFEKQLDFDDQNIVAKTAIANTNYYIDLSKMNSFDNDLKIAEEEFSKVGNLPENDPEYRDKRNIYFELLRKKYSPDLFDRALGGFQTLIEGDYKPSEAYLGLGNIYNKKGEIYHFGSYNKFKFMGAEKAVARDKAYSFYQKAIENYKIYLSKQKSNAPYIYYELGLIYYNMSKLEPNVRNLPITKETQGDYKRYGQKFYKRDMLNRSIANFNVFLSSNPQGSSAQKVRILTSEMRLAMLNLW